MHCTHEKTKVKVHLNEEEDRISQLKVVLVVIRCYCFVFCVVSAGLAFQLSQSLNEFDSIQDDVVVDFERTEFKLFDFIAICGEFIYKTRIDADND